MKTDRFEVTVRKNLSRSFIWTIIALLIFGALCGGNGVSLLLLGAGFTLGLFDASISGILYILLWVGCMWFAMRIIRNGYRRSYELFLHQIDMLGKRETVFATINAMPRYPLNAAKDAVLLMDKWGIAYARRETFAVIPADKILKTHISSMVRRSDKNQKPIETCVVVSYSDEENVRVPVRDREEAQELMEKMETLFRKKKK